MDRRPRARPRVDRWSAQSRDACGARPIKHVRAMVAWCDTASYRIFSTRLTLPYTGFSQLPFARHWLPPTGVPLSRITPRGRFALVWVPAVLFLVLTGCAVSDSPTTAGP